MHPSDLERAISAAAATARALGLRVDDGVVLQNSNKLALHLRPCDSFARVAPVAHGRAQMEIDLATRLAEAGAPVAAPDPRLPLRVHERDAVTITFWTYYAPEAGEAAPAAFAGALANLHEGMRRVRIAAPHFTDRVAEAETLLADPGLTPDLPPPDRAFLTGLLQRLRRSVLGHGAAEQMLHGEPHAGNLLNTREGPRFIDFETVCVGPVEFDLAHAPEAVAEHYPGADPDLLGDCRGLVLAMVAAWRWDAADDFPDRDLWRHRFMNALRAGPPWPSLQALEQPSD